MSEQQPYRKPLPAPTPETQEFWDKARQHELWIPRCNACGHTYFPPRFICPECLSRDVAMTRHSGKGTLHSYMINHRAPPGFEDDAPYAIAVIQLEDGPRIMSNIVGIENTPENLVLDMALEVTFEDAVEDVSIPKWKPASS